MARKGLWITGGIVAGVILIGALGSEGDSAPTESAPAPTASATKVEAAPKPKPELSQAEQFKAFVAKNGTSGEKDAAVHVTKVQGSEEQNDMLDSAEIHTDYTGDIMSGDTGKGKLLASAFADWKDSENGLVTVYNATGDILSNGNF